MKTKTMRNGKPFPLITKGIQKLPKPRDVFVYLDCGKPVLEVKFSDGTGDTFPISKAVAEVLIANDLPYIRDELDNK